MIKFEGLILVISLVIMLYGFVDCAMRDEIQIQKFPKWAWLLIIFFFGALGSIAYLFMGRIGGPSLPQRKPQKRKILPPDDNPDFLRGL